MILRAYDFDLAEQRISAPLTNEIMEKEAQQ